MKLMLKAGLLLGLVVMLLIPTLSAASSTTAVSRPTLTQLESDIAASVKTMDAPPLKDLIPTLSENWANVTMVPMPRACYYSWPLTEDEPIPANATTQCEWGDTTATRSIFLIGDSQSAMWLPTFNTLGLRLGWKIFFLAKSGCPPWITSSPYLSNKVSVYSNTACKAFVKSEIAFVNSVHPTVVIPIGLQVPSRTDQVTEKVQEASTLRTIAALKPSRAKILFLAGFSWTFGGITPQDCLTIHPTDLPGCEANLSVLSAYPGISGLEAAAKKEDVGVVPTLTLFCAKYLCPIFVKSPSGDHLIYFDDGHMNNQYSVWISRAFGTLIQPYLPNPV